MKEIKFSTANHPDQWWADDFGGVIRFASAADAKAAERLFNALAQRTEPGKCAWPDYERRYESERAAGATHDHAHHAAAQARPYAGETPRTNAIHSGDTDNRHYLSLMIEHARQLERELYVAQEKIDDLRSIANVNGDWTMKVIDLKNRIQELEAQLSAIEPRKPCPYCNSDNPAIRGTYYDQTCKDCVKRMMERGP